MRLDEIESPFDIQMVDNELNIVRISNIHGHIDIMENAKYSPATNSVSEFYVEPESRGKGAGDQLLKEAMKHYNDIGAQVSSKESLHLFMKNGFIHKPAPQATFDELLQIMNENSSIFMRDGR